MQKKSFPQFGFGKKIASVFENCRLSEDFSVLEQIDASLRKWRKKESAKQIKGSVLAFLLFLAGTIFWGLSLLPLFSWLKTVCALLSVCLTGFPIVLNGIYYLRNKKYTEEVSLLLVASIGGWILKGVQETALLLILFTLFRMILEFAHKMAKKKFSPYTSASMKYCRVLEAESDTRSKKTALAEIKTGDRLYIKKGEIIPVNVKILRGRSVLNLILFGEGKSRVKPEDFVKAGSINMEGNLIAEAQSGYENTPLFAMMQMKQSALEQRTDLEKNIKVYQFGYTLGVVAFLMIIFIINLLLRRPVSESFYSGLCVISVSSLRNLYETIALVYYSGCGRAVFEGVLIKGGNGIEHLAEAKGICFDKENVLTTREMDIVGFAPSPETSKKVLQMASSLEQYENHPMANSIMLMAKENEIQPLEVSEYTIEDEGISGKTDLGTLRCGIAHYLISKCIASIPPNQVKDCVGHRCMHVALEDEWIGKIIFHPRRRKEIKTTLQSLKNLNIHDFAVLTGDTEGNTKEILKNLPFTEYWCDLLPGQKKDRIMEIQEKTDVIYVGNGETEISTLSSVDCGISVGENYSKELVESAEVIMLNPQLTQIPKAIILARNTHLRIHICLALYIAITILIWVLCAIGSANLITALLLNSLISFGGYFIASSDMRYSIESDKKKKTTQKKKISEKKSDKKSIDDKKTAKAKE